MILFFGGLCIFAICFYLYYSRKTSPAVPSLHRKWTWKDEIKDNHSQWLPFLVVIIVITAIVLALALVSATEANIYYYGGLA